MSTPTKKRKVQPRGCNSSAADDKQDNAKQMVIDVEFEGRNPETSDFHGVKQLLQQLFLKADVNLSDMASVLVNQNTIGCVLKQVVDDKDDDDDDDDDDVDSDQVFGITTILNITEKRSQCAQQLYKLLLDLSKKHGKIETFHFINDLLMNHKQQVALLINERYVNIPPPVSVPLLQSISKELQIMKYKTPAACYAYLVIICKIYKKKQSNNKNETYEGEGEDDDDDDDDDDVVDDQEPVVWSNAEEEIFDEEAVLKFEFCVKNEKGSGMSGSWDEEDPEMIPYRRVLFIPTPKLNFIVNKIKCNLNQLKIN